MTFLTYMTVVVMLAEADKNYLENQAKNIQSSFTRQVTNALLQIISPDPSAYFELSAIPKSWGILKTESNGDPKKFTMLCI